MKSHQTISCCMMVKDEEKNIRRCLDSIKDCVDEIVVVDTGSTDNTVDIVAEYTDKIYHHPWEDDFSKHRNQSISYSSGDWILIVDADEELVCSDHNILHDLVANKKIDSVSFTVKNFDGSGKLIGCNESVRLFKNGQGIHYEDIVHNQLIGCSLVKKSGIEIRHFGYRQNPEEQHKKFKRTTNLLKKQLRENPECADTYFYLSAAHTSMGMDDKGLEYAKKAISLIEHQDIKAVPYARAYYDAARILVEKKNLIDEAEDLCKRCIKRFGKEIDPYAVLVEVSHKRKNWSQVIEYGEVYLSGIDDFETDRLLPAMRFIVTIGDKWKILSYMGDAYLESNKIKDAFKYYEQALSLSDDKAKCYRYVGLSLFRKNMLDMARRYFLEAEKLFGKEKDAIVTESLFKMGYLLKDSSLREIAVEGVRTIFLNENGGKYLHNLGEFALQYNDYIHAKVIYKRLLKHEPDDDTARLQLVRILLEEMDIEELVYHCDILMKKLKLPANITLNSFKDLEKILVQVAESLSESQRPKEAQLSWQIIDDLRAVVSG